ncbi:MAG: methyltransferase [Pirellulaceae bacterium]|nr:methyltransferase [Pirellulaceae bacterium]
MSIYSDGTYLSNNPSWHLEDSPFKAKYIYEILSRASIRPTTLVEVGCGVGGILGELRQQFGSDTALTGYDISPDAIETAKKLHLESNIEFHCKKLEDIVTHFDVLVAADVFEHVPDYLGFISSCRTIADYKIFHIPLDIHLSSVMRGILPSGISTVGHLHYFTRESALGILKHCGYQIIDSKLTPGAIELARLHPSLKTAVANIPRRLISLVSEKWASRLLGGFSLLVLAE